MKQQDLIDLVIIYIQNKNAQLCSRLYENIFNTNELLLISVCGSSSDYKNARLKLYVYL